MFSLILTSLSCKFTLLEPHNQNPAISQTRTATFRTHTTTSDPLIFLLLHNAQPYQSCLLHQITIPITPDLLICANLLALLPTHLPRKITSLRLLTSRPTPPHLYLTTETTRTPHPTTKTVKTTLPSTHLPTKTVKMQILATQP